MNNRKKIFFIVIAIPWIVVAITLVSNFIFNKSNFSLRSVINTSATNSYKKNYYIRNQERNAEYIVEQWHNGTSITLSIYDKNKNELLQIGGNLDTYIGLYDFNNDGLLDVYLFSVSKWPQQGIWLATTNGYKYINSNLRCVALYIIKFFSYANIYIGIILLFNVIWTIILLCFFAVFCKPKHTSSAK